MYFFVEPGNPSVHNVTGSNSPNSNVTITNNLNKQNNQNAYTLSPFSEVFNSSNFQPTRNKENTISVTPVSAGR